MKFEMDIKYKSKNKLLKEWNEITREIKRRGYDSQWLTTRREFFEKVGGLEWVKAMDAKEDNLGKLADEESKIRENAREREEKERWQKIIESRYNEKYIEVIVGKTPAYLEGNRKKEEVRTIARFRVGNEERNNKFWEEDEKKKCRICYLGKETLDHLRGICAGMEVIEEERNILLGEDGAGLAWMEKILKVRQLWEKRL